jgi:hypothetical protein
MSTPIKMSKNKGPPSSGKNEERMARPSELYAPEARSAVAAAAEPAVDFSALKMTELREMCRNKGLSSTGKKKQLVARLSELDELEAVAAEAATTATPAKAVAITAEPALSSVDLAAAALPGATLSAPNERVYCIQLCKNSGAGGTDLFEGFVENGRRNGDSRYTWADGDVLLCTWING